MRKVISSGSAFLLMGLLPVLCFGAAKEDAGSELVYRLAPAAGQKVAENDVRDTVEIMARRLKLLDIKGVEVAASGEDSIAVRISGEAMKQATRVKAVLTRAGRLEFRLVADEKKHEAILAEAEKTGKAPAGWHWYTLEQEDVRTPGKMETVRLLVSDEIGLAGEKIDSVTVGHGGFTNTEIAMHLTFKDRDAFWNLTRNNVGRRLAIVFDDVRDKDGNLERTGQVHSAPWIREGIHGGAEITGGFTAKTAEDLKALLSAGVLRHKLELVSEKVIQAP